MTDFRQEYSKSRNEAEFYCLRAYIEHAHYPLPIPGRLDNFTTDADKRLPEIIRGLGLPDVWLTMEGNAQLLNGRSSCYEAFYSTRVVDVSVWACFRLLG